MRKFKVDFAAVNSIDEIGDRLNSAFQDPRAVAIGSRQLGAYSLLHLFRQSAPKFKPLL
jgi:hypothetical protein